MSLILKSLKKLLTKLLNGKIFVQVLYLNAVSIFLIDKLNDKNKKHFFFNFYSKILVFFFYHFFFVHQTFNWYREY